jgi:hypothetical protein
MEPWIAQDTCCEEGDTVQMNCLEAVSEIPDGDSHGVKVRDLVLKHINRTFSDSVWRNHKRFINPGERMSRSLLAVAKLATRHIPV